MQIKILHTNDIHGRLENLAKISALIKELRNDNTILLDGGDFYDFMRIELTGTKGRAGSKLLDYIGYDGIAVGNNETFQGIGVLRELSEISKTPFLSCNLKDDQFSAIGKVRNSIILERGGLKFLIIGTSPQMDEFFDFIGFKTVAAKEGIRQELDHWRGRFDLCILLSHSGIWADREFAREIEGIDIIIGGHSHTVMHHAEVVNKTLIHHAGCYGEYLGVLEVEFDGEIRAFSSRNIEVSHYGDSENQLDEEVMDLIISFKEEGIDNLSRPLYHIEIDLWHDVLEENPMTNLLADGLRQVFTADLGLINSGVLNGGIRRGSVTEKKLLEICPSPLNPTYFEIKGKYLREALEKSIYADVCLEEGKGSGFRGRYLGKLHISGAVIYHDGRKVKEIVIGGEKLEEEKIYSVATSDYLHRGSGYKALAHNQNEKYESCYLRDVLRDMMSREEALHKALCDRWIKCDSY